MKKTEDEPLTLRSMGFGAAEEMWGDKLQEVLRNIDDVTTKATAPREVLLRAKLVPNDDRSRCVLSISVETKLAGRKPHTVDVFTGYDVQREAFVAFQHDPRQATLFGGKGGIPKINEKDDEEVQ